MEDFNNIPEEILQEAEKAMNVLLPSKSKDLYEKEYNLYKSWKIAKRVTSNSEEVLLAYFSEWSTHVKPSCLWPNLSMLKKTLRVKENIDISNYCNLIDFIKTKNKGVIAKKSHIFNRNDLNRFLNEAPDNKYLLMKVVTIFGVCGACRRDELYNLCVDNVQEEGNVLVVHLERTKTNITRKFTIVNDAGCVNYVEKCQQYFSLHPKHVEHRKLFIFYNNGRCTLQPIGINTFGRIPKEIASFLNIPEAKLFIGHCFRRTSATLLADSGADILTLKRQSGWRSSSVAESYIEDSIQNKIQIGKRIAVGSDLPVTAVPTASTAQSNVPGPSHVQISDINISEPSGSALVPSNAGVVISNLNNCTLNINICK